MRQHHVRRELLGLQQGRLPGEHRAAEVEHGPVADRVIDHVPVGPGPERRVGLLQVLRHLGGRDGGAEDDGAGRQRLAVADDAFAHDGIDAVGADQGGGRDAARRTPASPTYPNPFGSKPGHRAVGAKLDQLVRAAGVEQRAMDVRRGAHRVGIAEARLEPLVAAGCWRPPRR